MTTLRISALTARTVGLCLTRPGTRYHLTPPAAWRLIGAGCDREGLAEQSVIVIDGLSPDTDYVFQADGWGEMGFRTAKCAGLIDIRDFGVVSGYDDWAMCAANAAAFDRAVAAVPPGGTLHVPPGQWWLAPVALRSRMTLWLEQGAVLSAPSHRTNWPILPARTDTGMMLGSWEGLPAACFAAPAYAIDAQDLTIAGLGRIDGGGHRGDWWSWPKETRDGARRPRGLHLIGCTNAVLLGFELGNAPSWTLHPQGCTDLTIVGLHITAPADSPNTDGCDPEMCRNVLIEGVRFSVGDDCIAIKSGKRGPDGASDHLCPTEDVTVRHCLMQRGHGGVVIGSEMSGGVTDVTVEACEMEGTDRGLRIKTRRGRGGTVDRIRMHNVGMDGVQTALSANAHYHCDPDGHDDWVQSRDPAPFSVLTPTIGAITVSDVDLHRVGHAVGAFLGLVEAPIGPIRLTDIRVHSFDPSATPGRPVMADQLRPLRHASIVFEHAEVTTTLPISASRMSEPQTQGIPT